MTEARWLCPLCNGAFSRPAEHLRDAHGLERRTEDRLKLEQAVRRPPAPPRRPRIGSVPPARRPAQIEEEELVEPGRPPPLPPDAAVLRLVCDEPFTSDLSALQARLTGFVGVQSVAIDLYARTVDLYIDRRRAMVGHLMALARERARLVVLRGEVHREPKGGGTPNKSTRLFDV
ncbi:MAG: hypothetical protein U0821_11460 [Chloroflexota bacterium]